MREQESTVSRAVGMRKETAACCKILMAEDDPDDRLLALKALNEFCSPCEMRFVEDGEELIAYLRRRGQYAEPRTSPRPRFILLDLNMPRKNGREALEELKSDPELCSIPIIVLTTSESEDDILRSYQLGANSFITKPVTFDGLIEVMRGLNHYWCEVVSVPGDGSGA
jgi:CheY-like chemotaxis protein